MLTDELDYPLPPELIAQTPLEDRAGCRMLVYRRSDRSIKHRTFRDLPDLLNPGDCLVFNDARVLPARFDLRRPTGGRVEALYLRTVGPGVWDILLKNAPKSPVPLGVGGDETVTVVPEESLGEGRWRVRIEPGSVEPAALLNRVGRMPLPPYIGRATGGREQDRNDYQTVYASGEAKSVAAPTAGLHFDRPLLQTLSATGVRDARLTLHVGAGTFKPVTAEQLDDHVMHGEVYTLPADAAETINDTRRHDGRVVAVGTTSARVLETQPPGDLTLAGGETAIFIRPPYVWKHVDVLVTNFHLPRSTLVALIAAKIGLDETKRAYAEAVRERYRFFSYGDAMLIL